ncbi:hypothetical protein ABZ517_05525 [Streptomyces scabiei]|mgnify:CR=1 FL=1|uniref:hypothetical protein n=1 Tax=Streptomyces scabiei TaxID=1930 RepID=UPI0033DBCE08
MAITELEFDLSLLSEAALANDPHPDRPYLLCVLGYSDAEAGVVVPSVEIRTNSAQLGRMIEKYRALQLSLAARGTRRARAEETPEEAKLRLLMEANSRLPKALTEGERVQLLRRLQSGLERRLGPVPEDSPRRGIGP